MEYKDLEAKKWRVLTQRSKVYLKRYALEPLELRLSNNTIDLLRLQYNSMQTDLEDLKVQLEKIEKGEDVEQLKKPVEKVLKAQYSLMVLFSAPLMENENKPHYAVSFEDEIEDLKKALKQEKVNITFKVDILT
jgi:hypothetical protein